MRISCGDICDEEWMLMDGIHAEYDKSTEDKSMIVFFHRDYKNSAN